MKKYTHLAAVFFLLLSWGAISQRAFALSQAVVQGYFTEDASLRPGMVVQLSQSGTADQQRVERATANEPTKTIGLATTPSDSFVLIGNGLQQVYVQSSGETQAYTTDIGGEIKNGDLLTLSPLKGMLMRTEEGSGLVVLATALEDFPAGTAEKFTIDGGNTNLKESLVVRMRVNLNNNSFAQGQILNNSTLTKLGRSVVGKNVGEIRVVIALIIFLIVLVAEGGIIYGAISSAIIALGRNPLASRMIKRELARVLIIATIVLGVGLASIYGVLWI